MFCRFDKIVIIRVPSKISTFSYPFNIKKFNRENRTLKTNIRFGNSEPCKCERCNPNTSNQDRRNETGN